MAEKTVAKAQEELAAMQAQRDDLAGKVADLQGELDRDIDASKAASEVDRLSMTGADLETKRRVLAAIEERMPAVKVELKAAQDRERQAAILALHKVEAKQWEAAQAVLFGELDKRVSALAKTHNQIYHLGGRPKVGYSCVFKAIIDAKWQRARDSGDYTGMPFDWPKHDA